MPSKEPVRVNQFRNACYFFEKTSLDSAANDFVDDALLNEQRLPLEEATRDLAPRVVRSGL